MIVRLERVERAVRQVQDIVSFFEMLMVGKDQEKEGTRETLFRVSLLTSKVANGMIYLLIFWLILQLLRTRISSLSSPSTQLSISPFSLNLSTSLFNSFPLSVLNWIPHRHTQANKRRRLRVYWDTGVILILISFILSQLILFYALLKALRALYTLSTIPSSSLIKRAPIPDSPQSHLLIKPLVKLPLLLPPFPLRFLTLEPSY